MRRALFVRNSQVLLSLHCLPTTPKQQAAVMNERHRTAKRAQKDCSDLYLLLLLHAQVGLFVRGKARAARCDVRLTR